VMRRRSKIKQKLIKSEPSMTLWISHSNVVRFVRKSSVVSSIVYLEDLDYPKYVCCFFPMQRSSV
jgi:hypothetical protein